MKKYVLTLFFLLIIKITAQDLFKTPTVLPGANSDMSQGVSFADYNNDGWIDFVLTKGNDANGSSYLNYLFKGTSSGIVFEDAEPFKSSTFTSGTASWADIDFDGDLDLYIANAQPGFGQSKPDNSLIINEGDGTFTDATGNPAYGTISTDNEDSRHVGWGDYDNDGYPDLFIDNGAILFGPAKGFNSFYSNDGDGTFTKENESTVGNIAYSTGSNGDYKTFGSGFGWSDFDNDGDLDIFNASGAGAAANKLWKNNLGTGMFDDATPSAFQVTQTSFLAASWVDYDNDGDTDLFTANIEDGSEFRNFLYQNNSTASTVAFTDMTSIGTLVTDTYSSVGSAWGDYDNDGDLDVFISNKHGSGGTSVATLYENSGSTGSYNFSTIKNYNVSSPNDFNGRGVAAADVNNDGFLDLVAARSGSPLFFENVATNANKFTSIKLLGTGSTNKHALGSRVKVTANIPEQSGATTQLREVSGQSGGGAQNDMRAHFGFGTATKIDEVKAMWLNSSGGSTYEENIYKDLPLNKFMIFTKGDLDVTADVIGTQTFMYLFGNTGGAVEFTTADADGGDLSMERSDTDPGGTFDGSSATSPGGSTITPNSVFSDKFWTVSQTGLTGFTSTVYFDASGLTDSPDLDEVVLLKRNDNTSDWEALNTSRIGNTLYATGITSFSEFGIGAQSSGVLVETKIFLEGPYDIATDLMLTGLNGDIPNTSPYPEDAETIGTIPADIVDWVLVELRSTDTGAAVASESAFLHKDGRVVNDDASSGVIEIDAPAGNYYIVIKHRNHLPVMSANTISLNGSTSVLYDFTN